MTATILFVDGVRLGSIDRYEKEIGVLEQHPEHGWRCFAPGNTIWTLYLTDVNQEFSRFLSPLQTQQFNLIEHFVCQGMVLGAEWLDNNHSSFLRVRFFEMPRVVGDNPAVPLAQ